MDKKKLEQRCAEMRTRMLARNAIHVQPAIKKRASAREANQEHASSQIQPPDSKEIRALKGYIAELEAENRILRQRMAAMSVTVTEPRRSAEDSIREQ